MTSPDTSEAARAAQTRALRRIAPEDRLEIAFRMSEDARAISIEGMRSRNPGLTQTEARLRLLRRLLGDALFEAAYERRPK